MHASSGIAPRPSRLAAAAARLLAASTLAMTAACAGAVTTAPEALAQTWVEVWSHVLPDAGHPVSLSSPIVATLDGAPAVVVGDGAGNIFAFSLATGRGIPGWPAQTGGIPVLSTPSVAALSAGSPDDTVFVGVGGPARPHEGGYEAFNPDGSRRWLVDVRNPGSDAVAGATSAVMASLAVGELQGKTPDVVGPSVGQVEYAINGATGSTLPGWPWFTSDSGFSTPALADLYGDGQIEVIGGGDQTAGLAYGTTYLRGGHLRVIAPTGTQGTTSPTGGLDCEYNFDQGEESSPAVGEFLGGAKVGIVVGTSHAFAGAPDSDKVFAFGRSCALAWVASLNGSTESSPALASLQGNGTLDVLEGTDAGLGRGSVYALNGATGQLLWQQPVGQVIGSVATVDLGAGYQDVVVGTTNSAYLLDGRNGHVITTLERSLGLQDTPLVTDDPNGRIGITLAGYNGHNQGQVEHFELVGSSGADVDAPGAWPMFHHDPQLTGNAGVPVPALRHGSTGRSGSIPVVGRARCQAPAEGPNGYYETTATGAVYSYGNVAGCGSLPAALATVPVVGLAASPDGGGYWLVARDGHIFPFGDAKDYGPAHKLAPDIVGMATTPDGRGYWLVGSRGEVYAYGDAKGFGPGHPLAGPIVGMAVTADGQGYWLAGASGQVYAFGDALPSGPSVALSNIVGIAADDRTGGYWLVNSSGGVFPFGRAANYGSLPSTINEHVIAGIESSRDGLGYRLVDSSGSIFCFGTASQLGTAYVDLPVRTTVAIAAP